MKRRVVKGEALEGDMEISSGSGLSRPSSSAISKRNASSSSSRSTKIIITFLLLTVGALIGLILNQRQQFKIQSARIMEEVSQQMEKSAKEEIEKVKKTESAKIEAICERKLTDEIESKKILAKKLDQANIRADELLKKFSNENGTESEKVEKLEHELQLFKNQLEHVHGEIQRHDKTAALEEFGPGPHFVEFELDFPPEEIPEGDESTFVIELAPLDLMPHTVNFFLKQVKKGLLDGCSFHRNAGHVVQGGPIGNHLSGDANLRKPFADADLNSVSFQEYHADYPHRKYTLGYAGRPGGPDFYVSTRDNTLNHGPGGQTSYAIASEADPCFATVTEGFAAIDRMHKMSVKPGGYKRMNHYVAIKSAKILNPEL